MDPTHFLAAPQTNREPEDAFYERHGSGLAPLWARLFSLRLPRIRRIPRATRLSYKRA